jgi:hypothetical protein
MKKNMKTNLQKLTCKANKNFEKWDPKTEGEKKFKKKIEELEFKIKLKRKIKKQKKWKEKNRLIKRSTQKRS